ncbi:MAG: Uma2 family endonuclease [Cyanobacteriota bacterium]
MVAVTPPSNIPPPHDGSSPPFVTLRPITWQTYQAVLADLGEHRAVRLAYDRGTLEIKMPSKLHELINRLLERMIIALTEELGLSILSFGSTTFDSAANQQGVEPDSCFYIQNADRVDPEDDAPPKFPPDLVVEVDITSSSRSRLVIYQTMGVPEIWRYDQSGLTLLHLRDGGYVAGDCSLTFPMLSVEQLSGWVERGKQSKNHNALIQELRASLRG